MKRYRLTFSLPSPMENEVMTVEAPDEEIALEIGFEDANYYFPQWTSYECVEITEDDQA